MPMFTVRTCVQEVPEEFIADTAKLMATLLNKPVEKIMVMCHTSMQMGMGTSDDACAHVTVASIFDFSKENNAKMAPIITDHVAKQLSLDKGRIYVEFQSLSGAMVAAGGALRA